MKANLRTRVGSCLAAIGILLPGLGCSSAPTERAEPLLPFHVALLPVELSQRAGAPPGGDPEATDLAEGVQLAFDEADCGAMLASALRQGGFVRVTELHYPDDVPREQFLALEQGEQDAHWIGLADSVQADLLLTPVLHWREGVRTDINSAFWLNLPLFLLGGPMTWFVDDRSYFVDVQLGVDVYAVPPLLEQYASLEDKRSHLQGARAGTTEVPLDFIDRADHFGHYALSVLVPSGLLASESADVATSLRQAILPQLGEGLVRDLQAGKDQLLVADRMVDFFLRPEELQVVPHGSGHELRGDVYLARRPGAAPAMKEARLAWDDEADAHVEAGEARLDFETGQHVLGESRRNEFTRYPFVFPLPDGELPEYARLELVDGSSNAFRRTYLLPVRTMAQGAP